MSVEPPENRFEIADRHQWRDWLAQNYRQTTGIWLVTFKKGSGMPIVGYEAVVEEALCFGWVDSLPRKLDERRTMLYMAPRKAGSNWSRPNKERVQRMIDVGLMHEAGLAKVEAAKKDGSWTALDEVEDLIVPSDLAEALASFERASANFDGFPRSAKRGILEWILNAKTPATRLKRIQTTAELADRNERANQWPRRGP